MATRNIKVALRAYTVPVSKAERKRKRIIDSRKRTAWVKNHNKNALWIDTLQELTLTIFSEASRDEAQQFLFAGYQVHRKDSLIAEGLIYPDNLPTPEIALIKNIARQCNPGDLAIHPQIEKPRLIKIQVIRLSDFLKDILVKIAYQEGGLLIGFDLPRQISRLASGFSLAETGFFKGCLQFYFKEYKDEQGNKRVDIYTPRMVFKNLGNGRAIIQWVRPIKRKGTPKGGDILDIRTLTGVFTGEKETLESACKAFEVKGKLPEANAAVDDSITPAKIHSCRARLQASWELYQKELDEASRHPVAIPPSKWYSPGSLGKAYLQKMGIEPPGLFVEPSLNITPNEIQGLAMATYHGARAETRVCKDIVPVASLDFISMYADIFILQNLWSMLISNQVKGYDDTQRIREWVEALTIEDCYDPITWPNLNALVCIQPDRDFLPVRGGTPESKSTVIQWGYLRPNLEGGNREGFERWFSLADIVASKINTGKTPRIMRALRFETVGQQTGLQPVSFRGKVKIDPYKTNFFKSLVEERYLIKKTHTDKTDQDIKGFELCLKNITNSTSYGTFIELNPEDLTDTMEGVMVYSDRPPYQSRVDWYEKPGLFSFPLIGTFLTAGAHLMLALLQHEVEIRGGTYVFADTDSMAVVASHFSNPLEEGNSGNDHYSIPVLSFSQVQEIVDRFSPLNPYDRSVIPGSILKIEKENNPLGDEEEAVCYNTKTKEIAIKRGIDCINREGDLLAYASATKRYFLFNRDNEWLISRKSSKINLSEYQSPIPNDLYKRWIDASWLWIAAGDIDQLSTWRNIPALFTLELTSPVQLKAYEAYNRAIAGNDYSKSIKPFNILAHPLNSEFFKRQKWDEKEEKKAVNLITSFSGTPEEATNAHYINLADPTNDNFTIKVGALSALINMGEIKEVSTSKDDKNEVEKQPPVYTVRSYEDVIVNQNINRYEGRMDTESGKVCYPSYRGKLYHPELRQVSTRYIGKELTSIEAWILSDTQERELQVYDPDYWNSFLLRTLKNYPIYRMAELTGLAPALINQLIQGKVRPSTETVNRFQQALPYLVEWEGWEKEYWTELRLIIKSIPTSFVVKETGLSRREVLYLKSGERKPKIKTLEKVRAWLSTREVDVVLKTHTIEPVYFPAYPDPIISTSRFPLTIAADPQILSEKQHLKNRVNPETWKYLRKHIYRKYHYSCAICGIVGKPLNVVEVWNYNYANSTRKLIDIIPMCRPCKQVVYFDLMYRLEKVQDNPNSEEKIDTQELIQHFMEVNQCAKIEFKRYCVIRSLEYIMRKWRAWTSDYGDYSILLQENTPIPVEIPVPLMQSEISSP